jgi:hypothetical protein
VIAEAVAGEHFSAIIDLSLFRKGEALRFMAAFLETLYRKNREALHLFIDEADVVAPQKPFGPDEARVLGACEDIVRRGRIRGIGCTLITQRPQVLNKNVLSQVDMLTALRMNHPKDLGAIKEWVAVHGDEDRAAKMLDSLPALPIGDAWLWAPGEDLFERATIRRRRTFDSGRTPKAGEHAVTPKVLAQVDIARLGQTIAATVEQAKANDPKALKARIAELEKQVAAKAPAAKVETKTIEKLAIKESQLQRIGVLIEQGEGVIKRWDDAAANAHEALAAAEKRAGEWFGKLAAELGQLRGAVASTKQPAPASSPAAHGGRVYPSRHAAVRAPESVSNVEGMTPAKQRILDTAATLGAIGVPCQRETLAAWLGCHPNGKSYVNNVGALRSAGLLDDYSLTDAGRLAANVSAPTPDEVRRIVFDPLSPAQRRIVDLVFEHGSIGREELATALGCHPNGKTFVNNIGALRGRAVLSDGWPIEPGRALAGIA